jgi:uncharacterized protein
MRHEEMPRHLVLSWEDVDRLIDTLLPQMSGTFDALLMVTRGGIVPGGMIAEALDIKHILVAAVEFASDTSPRLLAWPTFSQFPDEPLVRGRRVLVVDDVWTHGRHIMTVRGRLQAYGARPELAVLHYKPGKSLFPNQKPNYFADVTDDHVIYPWEADRRPRGVRLREPQI